MGVEVRVFTAVVRHNVNNIRGTERHDSPSQPLGFFHQQSEFIAKVHMGAPGCLLRPSLHHSVCAFKVLHVLAAKPLGTAHASLLARDELLSNH